ncbi:MAG: hypothetical protein RI943_1241 [Bacteroidota bacterium]|jgi:hypothetical protein
MNQTAVEWLVTYTELNYYSDNDTLLAIEQAKEMEKQKMIEFSIWLNDTIHATHQIGGKHEGMWHAHIPDSGKDYFTNEEILNYWKSGTII